MSQQSEVLERGAPVGMQVRSRGPAREAPDSLKRIISGASLVLGGTFIWQGSGFIFNAVGAHALGPARYGVLAASTALLGFATPLLFAIQAVASREVTSLAARKERVKVKPMLRHYGLRVTGGGLVLGGIAAATSTWISSLFHLGSPWLVVIVGAAIPGYVVGHLLGGVLQGAERFGRFALESVVEGSAKAILGVLAMGLLWHSVFWGVAAVTMSCVVGVVTYLLLTLPLLARNALWQIAAGGAGTARAGDRDGPHTNITGASPGVARYSVTALVVYGLLAIMVSSDTLVAKHYFSNHEAGLYAGVSLTGKIAYFAASALFVVGFPLFSRHYDSGIDSGKWILAAGGLVAVITGAIVVAFALEPAWVVIPLLGTRYQTVEGYVPWMAAVYSLYALGYLVSIYLLARKCRSVIAVLAVALIVQFVGFFFFHSTITMMMSVLAVAFAVLCGGGMLVAAHGGRQTETPNRRAIIGATSRAQDSGTGMAMGPAGEASSSPPGAPGTWQEQIVTEITARVGPVPVLLAGSRALGTAHADSDYDVTAILPLRRIPRAVPSLAEAAQRLSAGLGRDVSVNPVPRFRMRRPGGSLFVGKLQAEAVVLAAPPGWFLHRQPLAGVTTFAASSALLSAAQILLETFDTSAMKGGAVPPRAGNALQKAALHVAQVRLLRSGRYASDLPAALAELRSAPPSANGDAPGAELACTLTAGLVAADAVQGFLSLRRCILIELGGLSDKPFRMSVVKSLVRNVQYAALARLRGRNRWRAAFRWAPVEAALAETQLALLRALDPDAVDGVDAAQLRLAAGALPASLAAESMHSWEDLRDLVLAEWRDAHPLVGVMA
jgi:O-antigen/teichoic acid export membrane protein